MKNLMTSTAMVAFTAIAAQAQDANPFRTEAVAGEVYASDFIGTRVYTAETELAGPGVAGVQTDWDDICEINDVVLSRDGTVDAVLVDIGGFLGMGEKPVALKLSELNILRENNGDDIRVYVSQTKEQLESLPDYVN